MTDKKNSPMVPISEFVGTRQSDLFKSLKQPRFTGELIFKSSPQEEWIFYLYLGRILYATGGNHPVRRWIRNIKQYKPQIIDKIYDLQEKIKDKNRFKECWEYEILALFLEKQQIDLQEIKIIISSIIVEILFDLTQTREVTFELKNINSLSKQLVLIDSEQIIAEAWQDWQGWQNAKLASYSPNKAPIIKESMELQKRTSPQTFENMSKLFNGKNTLRDIAIQLKQDLIQITRLMIPYVQSGLIELIEIDDLYLVLSELNPKKKIVNSQIFNPPSANSPSTNFPSTNSPLLIVYINESLLMSAKMKQIFTKVGHDFLSFNDSDLAVASILAQKPDFIFVDSKMHDINGYKVVAELRRITDFKEIPIVLITENENLGLMDKLQIKLSGCSDIMAKPIRSKKVLAMISKHIQSSGMENEQ